MDINRKYDVRFSLSDVALDENESLLMLVHVNAN